MELSQRRRREIVQIAAGGLLIAGAWIMLAPSAAFATSIYRSSAFTNPLNILSDDADYGIASISALGYVCPPGNFTPDSKPEYCFHAASNTYISGWTIIQEEAPNFSDYAYKICNLNDGCSDTACGTWVGTHIFTSNDFDAASPSAATWTLQASIGTNYQECKISNFQNSSPMARAVLVARGPQGPARPDPRVYYVVGIPAISGGLPDGREVPAEGLGNDVFFVSPPNVAPIYSCSDAVFVSGIVPGAAVEVLVNSQSKAMEVSFGTELGFHLGTPLMAGELVAATQTIDAATSKRSTVTVENFTDTFPKGLPRPQLSVPPFFECGAAIGMANYLGGSKLFFEGSATPNYLGSLQNDGNPNSDGIPTARPFKLGEMLTGHYEFCGEKSENAEANPVVPAPKTIPPPIVEESYDGMKGVPLSNLLHGARVTLFLNGQWWFSFYTRFSEIFILSSTRLAAGHSVTAKQALCSESDLSAAVEVLPCSALPAPRIRRPLPGDQFVIVTRAVPEARILVYDEQGIEIGDGSGSRILLARPLAMVERLRVVQRVAGCRSQTAYEIHVDCGPKSRNELDLLNMLRERKRRRGEASLSANECQQ